MRITRLLALLLAFALVAAACGGDEEPAAGTTAPAAPATTTAAETTEETMAEETMEETTEETMAEETMEEEEETPTTTEAEMMEEGGTFTMATSGDLTNLKPETATIGHIAMYYSIYDTIVSGPSGAGAFVPDLAESWEISDDGLTYTFHVRPGVKFHNGVDLTAQHIIDVLEHYQDPANNLQNGQAQGEQGITYSAPDDLTLVFHLPDVFPGLLHNLIEIAIPYLPEADQGIGTGPFKVKSFSPGVEMVAERNEDFWGPRPPIDEYVVKQFADSAAAIIALETGEVHGFIQPPLEEAVRVAESPDFRIFEGDTARIHMWNVQTATPELSDKRVRKAVSLVVPRKEFVDINFGYAKPTANFFADSSVFYNPDDDFVDVDFDGARALLAEVGQGPFTIEFELSLDVNPEINDWLPLFQANLAEIGITLDIIVLETATWADRFLGGTFTGFSSAYYGSGGLVDPSSTLGARFTKPEENISNFDNEEYKRLVNSARVEIDPQKRIDLYQELARFMIDQAFVISVGSSGQLVLLASCVVGYNDSYLGRVYPDNIDMSDCS